jgi:hypothetical protein
MLDLSCITNNSTKEELTPKQTRFQLVEIYLGVINNIALLQTKTNESIFTDWSSSTNTESKVVPW